MLESAGIRDVLTKSFGTNNKQNVVAATVVALQSLTTIKEQAERRKIEPEKLQPVELKFQVPTGLSNKV